MRWITSECPKVDRLACTWLIRRFVDDDAQFRFVPANDVLAEARRSGAVPFDVPGAELRRVGMLCSFDAVLARYRIDDAALRLLAAIVRSADSGRTAGAPQSAGLVAVTYGLSRCFHNDDELLRHGFVVYDALYQWCRKAPPGPEFTLPRIVPNGGWWWALRVHRSRARAARVLAALNDATLRDIGLARDIAPKRAASQPGRLDALDLLAGASRARRLPHAKRKPERSFAVVLAWAASCASCARGDDGLADLNDHLLRDIGVSRVEAERESAKPFWCD